MAFAWPVEGQDPVVGDFSTAATAEGVIRSLRNRGMTAPDGVLHDADGRPTTDPATLYGTPKGTIQPFGGTLGYRGTALALLVETLTTLMAGEDVDEAGRIGTDMTLIAVAADDGFAGRARHLSGHLRASPPIDPEQPVMMPGDRERRAAKDARLLSVDPPTWAALQEEARRAGVPFPDVHDPASSIPGG